ncbi:hypothetical protein [Streptomyces sp. NPDC006610]|uniref:hypothetical protein n=1 Tax=Streptomyces sp. NPDC006610 TaxID=3154584 RepID=UPI0033ABC9DF
MTTARLGGGDLSWCVAVGPPRPALMALPGACSATGTAAASGAPPVTFGAPLVGWVGAAGGAGAMARAAEGSVSFRGVPVLSEAG